MYKQDKVIIEMSFKLININFFLLEKVNKKKEQGQIRESDYEEETRNIC